MPTLREIEAGLRARLAELSRVSGSEREARAAARARVERVAQEAASNNSIGEAADDLLEELGLHGRPREVTVLVSVELRQTIPPGHVRDIYINGMQVHGAYQNITECSIYTTFDIGVAQAVPRNHEGCACSIPITDVMITNSIGNLPATVQVVDTTVKWCGYNGYPYTNTPDMENACLTYRALRAQQQADAHDSPVVQACEFGHQYIEPHRHIFYRNGDVTYSVRDDYEPTPPSVRLPGWYGTGVLVGQPIPSTEEPLVPVEQTVERCSVSGHPISDVHVHVQFENREHPSYSRNLDYTSEDSEVVLPGWFSRDEAVVGTQHHR